MRMKWILYSFIVIFLLFVVSWQVSEHWGALSTAEKYTELGLVEFDRKVAQGGESCFTLQVASDFERPLIYEMLVLANNGVALRTPVDISKDPEAKVCIPAVFLSQGDNLIEIFLDSKRVFHHVELVDSLEESTPEVSLAYLGGDEVKVEVRGDNDAVYSPISIYVNGELDHRAYFSGKSFSGVEKVKLADGDNEIRAEFKGVSAGVNAVKPAGFKMNPVLGLLIISALLCVLAFLVFAEQGFFEKVAYTILSFFSIFAGVFFVLNITGMLSAFNFVVLLVLVAVILAFLFRKNLGKVDALEKINWKKKIREISPLLILLVCLVLFSSLFFNMFSPHYAGIWTSFYEREASAIAIGEAVPLTDEFSFLGTKPSGYISGYFFLNPGIAWLTGLENQQVFGIIMLLAQFAFIVCAYLFFRSYGLGKKAYLGVAVALFGGFVFSDFSFNLRHVIAYAFLFFSMYLLRKGDGIKSGLALGMGAFFQTPVFAFYLILLPIFAERKRIVQAVKALVVGTAVAIALYLPTLLSAGVPTQAKASVWGLLWGIPLYGLLLDYLAVFLFMGLFILPFVLLKQSKFGKFEIGLLAFIIIGFIIQLFVSYRINVAVTIALALLAARLFPLELLKSRFNEFSLAAFIALCYTVIFALMLSVYPVTPVFSSPYAFVAENTSTNANFLNEPYLGHSFIFFAERKSSADLTVEYAIEEMIDDSFGFLKTGDAEILEKYDIDYVLNRSKFLNERPVGDNYFHKKIEFEFMDKVYSNGFLYLHSVRN